MKLFLPKDIDETKTALTTLSKVISKPDLTGVHFQYSGDLGSTLLTFCLLEIQAWVPKPPYKM